MEITDGAAWAIGGVAAVGSAVGAWLYARISGVHGRIDGVLDRIDRVVNHMTAEDNKLHDRVDAVRDQYVRREDLDARFARFEKSQDNLLEEFKEHAQSTRHKMNNIEQVLTRMDERMKHVEERKP